MQTITLELPVRFAETDAMGVVHHSNYIIWFEAARVALLDALGMPYAEVAAGGNHFAVTAVQVAYRASARFGDVVEIVAKLDTLRSRQIKFSYEVYLQKNRTLLATGSTEHICVDLEGRMAKIPAHVMERLQQSS